MHLTRLILASCVIVGCGDGAATPDAATVDAAACARAVPGAAGDVLTTSGVVRGASAGSTYAFEGIPYAAPPLGPLRYAPPSAPACWPDVRPATSFGEACIQWNADHTALVGQEDCLTLNVWTPQAAVASTSPTLRPVMVFLHGGGHQQGASSVTRNGVVVYDGRPLAEAQDVVVVTLNYRLGALGYLATAAFAAADPHGSTGNYGTLDQLAALRWVQANITAFGGDPARVMVFGESAGGVAVCTLIASPLAAGLFSAAISESGPCQATTLAKAEAYGDTVVSAVGCAGAADLVGCMRGKTAAELTMTVPDAPIGQLPYDSVIDGYVLPQAPLVTIAAGLHNHVPVVFGTNREEMGSQVPAIADEAAYQQAVTSLATRAGVPGLVPAILAAYPVADYPSPRAAYVALLSDLYFHCSTRTAVRALAAHQTEPVYRYLYTHVADNASALQRALGAVHAGELPFVFGSLPSPGAGDRTVIDAFAGYWSAMAASGQPNGGGRLAWPTTTTASDAVLVLDAPVSTAPSFHGAQCDFWDAHGL